jgi:ATP-dependent protease HslVU (ClpYQ) peptidase subunit
MEHTTPRADVDAAQAVNTSPAVLERNSMIAALQFAAGDAFAELRELHMMLDLKADQLAQEARDLSKLRQQIEQTLNRLEGQPCFYYDARTGRIQK